MTAYEPLAEAVEAVAKIIDPSAWSDNWWGFRAPGDTRTAEELREVDRERARSDARAVLTAAGPIIAAEVRGQREAFLPSDTLDPAWVAGWHAAVDHVAARFARGEGS